MPTQKRAVAHTARGVSGRRCFACDSQTHAGARARLRPARISRAGVRVRCRRPLARRLPRCLRLCARPEGRGRLCDTPSRPLSPSGHAPCAHEKRRSPRCARSALAGSTCLRDAQAHRGAKRAPSKIEGVAFSRRCHRVATPDSDRFRKSVDPALNRPLHLRQVWHEINKDPSSRARRRPARSPRRATRSPWRRRSRSCPWASLSARPSRRRWRAERYARRARVARGVLCGVRSLVAECACA